MKSYIPLQPGLFYHIFNRGNNGEDLFREDRNYPYFLNLYKKHIEPVAETYAYCLLKNHFHFLVRIKNDEVLFLPKRALESKENQQAVKNIISPSKNFSNLFNAYTKAINKSYNRTGSLFEERFNRNPVTKDAYFLELIFYIHFNPQKHGFIDNFRDWRWSSYQALIGTGETHLIRDEVIELFGNISALEEYHRDIEKDRKLSKVIDYD